MRTEGSGSAHMVQGWCLTAWLGFVVLTICLLAFVLSPDPVVGARMVIRLTARTSLMLFVLAFTASSLAALLPSPATGWLRANRRYFGVAFAISHLIHAIGILLLSHLAPALFDRLTTPASFIAGGFGYAIILSMLLTSSDRAVGLLGLRAWQILHKAGAWFLALFFVINFGRRAVVMPHIYWPYMVLIFAAIVIRLLAARHGARAQLT